MRRKIPTALCLLMIAATLVTVAVGEESPIHFNRDIRPILSNYCYTCHGPDESTRETDLRLDLQESALSNLGDYHAIVPGDVDKSELINRIKSNDPDVRMPPPDQVRQLSTAQIALLERWIKQGAQWEKHWSQVPPEHGEAPPAIAAWQPRGEIDRYVHQRIQDARRTPAAEADARTLLRRLHFDLTGLPPTPKDMADFQARIAELNEAAGDHKANPANAKSAIRNPKSEIPPIPDKAIEEVVDRLLASPHYGERMAIWWLDLVRYADSTGYHSDKPRDVWMYRDWVIRQFNQNRPFDEFTIDQLAGDLFPTPTNDQRIAAGYNRLLQTTDEGGAQAKEYVAKYAADRVRNVSEVWMGATVGCAECHDHKFDPYTQKDFYSLAAFFADINEPGVGGRPSTPIPTPEFQTQLDQLDQQIAAAQQAVKGTSDQLAAAQSKWEAEQRAKLGQVTRSDFAWFDDQNRPNGKVSGAWNFIDKNAGPVYSGSQSRKQTSTGNVQHYVLGASGEDILTLAEGDVFYFYIYLDPKDPPQQIMLQVNDGSWDHRAWWGEDKIPYGGIGTNAANHRKMGPLPKAGEWVRLEVTPEQIGLKAGSRLNGMAFTQWAGTAYWDKAGLSRNGLGLPQAVVNALQVEPAQRDKQQQAAVASYYRSIAPELAAARARVDQLNQEKENLQKQMPRTLLVSHVKPREMRILPRGNWQDDSGQVVQPNTPTFLPPLGVEGRRATRLDLAHWLVDKRNPMVARAQMNRLWKLFFGHGLARTLEDLGAQGEWPTHPKLLDHLAVEFIDSGWDIKQMIKQMVMSQTYRQTSIANEEMRGADPYNRLFAHQSRYRLDAEMVRDNALTISGLLVDDVGGVSVKPYQPPGYWQHLNFPKRSWKQDAGESLYRRGLYTHWQRSFLHPSLLAFDAPSREECTAARPRSNTPQQALVLLNDPTYVESARNFAQRILTEGGETDSTRLSWAFRQAIQREPTGPESELLASLLAKHREQYQVEAEAAGALVSVGAAPTNTQLEKADHAAWTSVARVILNLHETITRQ